MTVYGYKDGPCYRCLFPNPPHPDTVTNCNDGGVIGPIPGMIGTLQATEIIKLLTGASDDDILYKRMLLYDGLSVKFRTVKIRSKIPTCQVCGPSPTITNVKEFDYDEFCQTKCDKYALISIPNENNAKVEDFQSEFYGENGEKKGLVDVRP